MTLEEAQARAKGFKVGLVRVEKYFEGTHITAYAGPPPEKELTDYCWGGCPGALEEAIEILRLFDSTTDTKMPRLHLVFGKYEGKIDAKPGEKVIFIGDCAQWKGTIAGESVNIESVYQPRETKDPHQAKHDDLYAKMVSVTARLASHRNKQVMRMNGCPVSVAEQVLALVAISGAKNPYFEKSEILKFNKAYIAWRAVMAGKRLRGQKYQVAGPTTRGDGRPEL